MGNTDMDLKKRPTTPEEDFQNPSSIPENGITKIQITQNSNGDLGSPEKCTFEDSELPAKRVKLLVYEIEDEPPWYLTAFLGFQHYLTMVGSTISVPFIITPLMCMVDDDPDKARLISTLIFVSGMVTLLQSTFGTRLPIIQGSSFSFVIPSLAILGLEKWKCPAPELVNAMNEVERRELWQLRMRELQGAIIVASLVEVLLGIFGIVGIILKYITPMTIAPAIAMIGLTLFHVSAQRASSNWWISSLTMVLVIIFSQYLKDLKIPLPFTKSSKRNGTKRYPIFQVFPVLISIAIAWLLCYILTATNALEAKDPARTDIKSNIIRQSDWFRVPWPFQWGWPTVTAGAVFGMMSGVIAGVVESIGDYMACARISGAKPPPTHALNRGIFIEGIGCVLAGIWGTGNGTTSFSENIGAISVTKVGSRRVIQAAGILMVTLAVIGKVGAVFISIPEPIVGGLFCIVFGTVTAVGLSNLQGVDLNSPRNIFIIGFSIFFGLTISQWTEAEVKLRGNIINSGSDSIDQIITILLSTGMFMSGLFGFFFDNTIPGTREERGLAAHSTHSIQLSDSGTQDDDIQDMSTSTRGDKTYDIPFVMGCIRRSKFLQRLPISPTYRGSVFGKLKLPTFTKKRKSGTINENT